MGVPRRPESNDCQTRTCKMSGMGHMRLSVELTRLFPCYSHLFVRMNEVVKRHASNVGRYGTAASDTSEEDGPGGRVRNAPIRFMDVWPMSAKRPDAHMAPPKDCLHWCMVGVMNAWSQVGATYSSVPSSRAEARQPAGHDESCYGKCSAKRAGTRSIRGIRSVLIPVDTKLPLLAGRSAKRLP
jgi:hypothetical protein